MIVGIEGVASFFELLDLVSVLADTSFLTYVFDSSLSLIIMETQLSYSTWGWSWAGLRFQMFISF